MRLDRDPRAEGPLLQGFAGGGFRVDGRVYPAGLLLTPARAAAWTPPPLADLAAPDLADLVALAPPPEFVLLGTGADLRRPPPALVAALDAHGIGLEPMASRAAARAWSSLRGEGRWLAAAFYPLG